jgi:hypothetical protein
MPKKLVPVYLCPLLTPHPSADWVMQQLLESFAEAAPYRYVILDRDSIFNADVIAFLKATGLEQNGRAFRHRVKTEPPNDGIGSCRREIFEHIIPVMKSIFAV